VLRSVVIVYSTVHFVKHCILDVVQAEMAKYDHSTQPLPGSVTAPVKCELSVELFCLTAGFSIDLNFQDIMTSKLKNLDVSVQNLEVMQ